MKRIAALLVLLITGSAFAKGGGGHSGGSHYSTMPSYGTGAKSEYSHVNDYTKRDGTYVAPYDRSTTDQTKNNNWSTKGNTNPETGKLGTQRGDTQ